MEMNFNNYTVSQLFTITELNIDVLPSVSISSKNVPSRHGTIFQGAQIGERTIEVGIMLKQDYEHQYNTDGTPRSSVFQNYVRSIVYYLQTDEPKKLIFSDEPDRYYWAICTGITIDRLLKIGQGTITFTCNDPYMYATEEKVFFRDVDTMKWLVDNTGTAEAFPKVRVEFESNATYLGVVTPESVIQIGNIANEETGTNTTKAYKDHIRSISNWYYGSQATMSRDCQFDPEVTCLGTGEVMRPSLKQYEENDKPESPYGWKGTQMMTDLPSDVHSKYFKARLQFNFNSGADGVRDPAQCGALQIHLLDANNNQIACVGMNDHDSVVELTNPYMKLGYDDVWKEFPALPTPTTKRYVKVFDNEEDVPADATITNKYERTKSYATVTIAYSSCPIYNTYKAGRKLKTTIKNKEGTKYRVKTHNEEKYGKWIEIYLNSKCTSTGWVHNNNVTYNEPESETVYVYTRKIYPDKNIGKYTDLWGYYMVTREPHNNGKGDIWTIELYRLQTVNGVEKATKLVSKKFTDSTGTKYTSGGKLAKVAVSFVSRGTQKPLSHMSFNYLYVQTINDKSEVEKEPHIIATNGDVIEIDYSVPSVELNGESILHEVDIGSRFSPLQPFMRTELELTSDGIIYGEVRLTDRFL